MESGRAIFSSEDSPLSPNNRKESVLRGSGETLLPWDHSRWFPEAEDGRKWRFTAYCGLYTQGRVRARLERAFGRDPANFDRRPDGESCLFALQITAEGRPLLDTFVLASCAWAVGRLVNPGPALGAWLNGFEAAAAEEGLRMAERFAIRENDEIGRDLNRKPGVHVGRPIQPGDLETEIERIAGSLGVTAVLQPKELRLAGRQVSEKYEFEADPDDFLNSFFLRDLECIAEEAARSNGSAVLSRFLSPEQSVHVEERCDVRTSMDSLCQNTAPQLVPAARWPAPVAESLYFSQQFALNSALDAFDRQSSPLFGVNGPPGTGKTTLLRDLIASIVVRRAEALAKWKHPEDAFAGAPAHWNTAGYERTIFLWRKELLGFEMVVASSNNRAVENVTLEIPAKRAVAEEYLANTDYFADFATRLLAERGQSNAKANSGEAWGLIAARLGSKRNRSRFIGKFWFADKESPQLRTRSQKGFQKYLQTVKAKPLAWKNAVTSFQMFVEREAAVRDERIAAYRTIEAQKALTEELSVIRSKLEVAEASALDARQQAKSTEDCRERCKSGLDESVSARRDHQDFKPGLVDAIFTRGAAYHEWREKDQALAAASEVRGTEFEAARAECDARKQYICDIGTEIARLKDEVCFRESLLAQQARLLNAFREKLGPALPSAQRWLTDPDERELSSPWADETWNDARTQVLIAALNLHRTLIEGVPGKIRKNLHGAIDILQGKVSPLVEAKALQSAWGSATLGATI